MGGAARRRGALRGDGPRGGGRSGARSDLRPMRRVLMTADTVGGVWTYATELIRALSQREVAVTLATMGPVMSRDQREIVQQCGVEEVHESTYPLEWMEADWSDVDAAGAWLLDLERRVRPDVVHLNGYVHATLPWHAPTIVVGHSCVTSWWQAVCRADPPPTWREYRRRVRDGLAAAGEVVTPSRAMLDDLSRCYGIDRGVVIPNGRTDVWERPGPKEPLIVCAARVDDAAKNAAALEAIAPDLEWPVAIIGGGGSHDCCDGAVTRLGRLPFDHLAGWLRRASIFVLPARYEPFGLGPLEAALAGCALVLGDIPSLHEVWGDAALYVDPD